LWFVSAVYNVHQLEKYESMKAVVHE
jgi:hypothetical protein